MQGFGVDQTSWPSCLGYFGTGKLNENGQRLLELYSFHGLCINNAFFMNKKQHRVSWRHPRSGYWHQLDLVITRRNHLNSVNNTRSYHSADCDTDHSLVCSKIKVHPMKCFRNKPKCINPRVNTTCTSELQRTEQYRSILCEAVDSACNITDV